MRRIVSTRADSSGNIQVVVADTNTGERAPGVDASTQPPCAWTIAAGQYGVSVGSSGQLTDTTTFCLSGRTPPAGLNGLFGWALE